MNLVERKGGERDVINREGVKEVLCILGEKLNLFKGPVRLSVMGSNCFW